MKKGCPMIGLMGVSDEGMLVTPSGGNLFVVSTRLGILIQGMQHWVAKKSWKLKMFW